MEGWSATGPSGFAALALLQLAEDASAPQIAKVIPLTAQAIRRLGQRYQQAGLNGALCEKHRPGTAEVLDSNQKQRIIAIVCGDPPEGRARWTVRLVAEESVKRKLVPAVGRENDPDSAAPPRPDRLGFEFAQVAFTLALEYPNAKTIHLVTDNLNIHRHKSLSDVFGGEMATEVWDRFTVHYTPTHGSWLNQSEIEIGMFSRQCLGNRRIPGTPRNCTFGSQSKRSILDSLLLPVL